MLNGARPGGNNSPALATKMNRCNLRPVRHTDSHTAHVLELLAPIGGVSARRMFGGTGLFRNGLMFGLMAGEELYFKAGDANRPDYEAAGEEPFSYDTKDGRHTLTSYWHCPNDLLDDPDNFLVWARKAIDASASAAKPKARKPRAAAKTSPKP